MKPIKGKQIQSAQDKYLLSLAHDLLKNLGNITPNKKQLELMALILSKVAVTHNLSFSKHLTVREKSCLYWAAMGMTSRQTATLLNVQHYTVDEHRKEIKRKLDCKSMAHAVFRGMQFGYIQRTSEETYTP